MGAAGFISIKPFFAKREFIMSCNCMSASVNPHHHRWVFINGRRKVKNATLRSCFHIKLHIKNDFLIILFLEMFATY